MRNPKFGASKGFLQEHNSKATMSLNITITHTFVQFFVVNVP